MTMYAIFLFLIMASSGLVLMGRLFTEQLTLWLAFNIYTLVGCFGLITLLFADTDDTNLGQPTTRLTLFMLAGLGRFFLATNYLHKQRVPKTLNIVCS